AKHLVGRIIEVDIVQDTYKDEIRNKFAKGAKIVLIALPGGVVPATAPIAQVAAAEAQTVPQPQVAQPQPAAVAQPQPAAVAQPPPAVCPHAERAGARPRPGAQPGVPPPAPVQPAAAPAPEAPAAVNVDEEANF